MAAPPTEAPQQQEQHAPSPLPTDAQAPLPQPVSMHQHSAPPGRSYSPLPALVSHPVAAFRRLECCAFSEGSCSVQDACPTGGVAGVMTLGWDFAP